MLMLPAFDKDAVRPFMLILFLFSVVLASSVAPLSGLIVDFAPNTVP